MFYTRRGDDGSTGLLGAGRVSKADVRIEALGTLDELTAVLGVVRASIQNSETRNILLQVQRDLYAIMAEIGATPENAARFRLLGNMQVTWLEAQIAQITEQVIVPKDFIIPGDTLPSAVMDLARTVTRRAERRLVELAEKEGLENIEIERYLNRLSSLCYVLELNEIQSAGQDRPTMAKE